VHLVYVYEENDKYPGGAIDATLDEALGILDLFRGRGASLHIFPNDHSMISWLKHGPTVYEIRFLDHLTKRRDIAQVQNAVALDALRLAFGAGLAANFFDTGHVFFRSSSWDPDTDHDYWAQRALSEKISDGD
jgi:hypothetical protein